MNSEQIELIIELIRLHDQVATHPQPPRAWLDRLEEAEQERRATAEDDD